MTAAVFAAECKLDQPKLQATPPGDSLEAIITRHQDHMGHPAVVRQIIVPPVKRTRKKNWIIMEPPVTSNIAITTRINSFEQKRSHDQEVSAGSHPPVAKRPCASPRKCGTPRKHPVTPPMRSCDPVQQLDLPGPSHHGNQQQSEQSSLSVDGISLDPEILESVINDTQLPQQLADSINAALHSVNTAAMGTTISAEESHDASDDLADRILEMTQSDLLELLSDLIPPQNND
ncbi:uncharacterized protein [Dysidea avara]